MTGAWVLVYSSRYFTREEQDPFGGEVPVYAPAQPSYVSSKFGEQLYIDGGDPFDYSGGCALDGLPAACSYFNLRVEAGTVQT